MVFNVSWTEGINMQVLLVMYVSPNCTCTGGLKSVLRKSTDLTMIAVDIVPSTLTNLVYHTVLDPSY